MSRLIDPMMRARTFAARRAGMVDGAHTRRRLARVERALSPRRNDTDAPDDFTTFFDEVDETPEASDDTVGRGFLVRNADADDVLSFGITAEDGTPILVDLSTVPNNALSLVMASVITGLTGISGVSLASSADIYVSLIVGGNFNTRKYTSLVTQWTQNLAQPSLGHMATDGTTLLAAEPSSARVAKLVTSSGANGSPATFGTFGTGNGQFSAASPIGICFDGTNAWVVDPPNNRVQKFTASTGAYVSQFDGSSSGLAFSAPTGIAIGPTSTHLYVLDPVNGRVVKFDKATHAFVATFDLGVGTGEGQIGASAEGIAIDALGRIWIADTPNHRINVYDATGVFLASIGSFGSGDNQLKSPKQIAFNAAGDVAYVADSGNGRLMSVQVDTGQVTPVITERAGSSQNVAANAAGTQTVTCSAGEVSIGGGVISSAGKMYMKESHRSGTTGWTILMFNDGATTNAFTPAVMCLKVPL